MEKNRDTLTNAIGGPIRLLALTALLTGCASIQTGTREAIATSLEDRSPRREIERFKNNREFVEALKTIRELNVSEENIFLSENPNAPVIIILGDVHGSPEIEASRLDVLKDALGVNFAGVEGWTQSMVQKKNVQLVKASEVDVPGMKEKGFDIAGLEDPALHLKAAKYQFIQAYVDGREAVASLEFLEQSGDTSSADYAMAQEKIQKSFDKIKVLLAYFGGDPKDKILSELEIPNDVFLKKDGETNLEYRDRVRKVKALIYKKTGLFTNSLWIQERNKSAARLMFEQMKLKDVKTAVIVFGSFHASGLIRELKALGDFTLVYVSPPDDNLIDILIDEE